MGYMLIAMYAYRSCCMSPLIGCHAFFEEGVGADTLGVCDSGRMLLYRCADSGCVRAWASFDGLSS